HHGGHLVDRGPADAGAAGAQVGQGRAQVQDHGRVLRGPAPRSRRRRRARADAGQERDPGLDADDAARGAAELRRPADRRAAELRVPARRAQAPARRLVMATQDEVIEYLTKLTPVDLTNLLQAIEDKWGVKAAPVAAVGGTQSTTTAQPEPEV